MINPYHVQVRRKLKHQPPSAAPPPPPSSDDDDEDLSIVQQQQQQADSNDYYVKMSLQLYQVDYKSFLLDFKSVPNATPIVQVPKHAIVSASASAAAAGENDGLSSGESDKLDEDEPVEQGQ